MDVVLHFYWVRWGNAPKDPLDAKLEKSPESTVSGMAAQRQRVRLRRVAGSGHGYPSGLFAWTLH